MLQRHELSLSRQRRQLSQSPSLNTTFKKKLETAEEELEPNLIYLSELQEEIRANRINNEQIGSILQQMIGQVTYPLTSVEILMDNFYKMDLYQNAGFKDFAVIQQKAEMIYIQSIMNDLKSNLIKPEKSIIAQQRYSSRSRVSQEEVRSIVENINSQIEHNRSKLEEKKSFSFESLQTESRQEVGDQVDLMKFFEGVRNSQSRDQLMQRQTIEKLKTAAHEIELSLTLKKGFLISKIEKIKNSIENYSRNLFIEKLKSATKISRICEVHSSYSNSVKAACFNEILLRSRMVKPSEALRSMFVRHLELSPPLKKIKQSFCSFSRTMLRNRLFSQKVKQIWIQDKTKQAAKFLEKLNFSRKQKISALSLGIQKIEKVQALKAKKLLLRKLFVPQYHILAKIQNVVAQTMKSVLQELKAESESNRTPRVNLSHRLKGKILMNLKAPESQPPVDIRHTFLNWYIKGNEQKVAKKIYNIWLTGSISKFSFFMRMKNLVNEHDTYKVRSEMKLFLIVFKEKMNKYYDFGQKSVLHKWLANTRKIRKLESAVLMLQNAEEQSNVILEKFTFRMIEQEYKQKVFLQKFCFRYLNRYVCNVQEVFNKWKTLPDIKRTKGQMLMRKILQRAIKETTLVKRETFDAFKENKSQGKQKKILFLRKIFNQDVLYLQKYMQVWRMKNEQEKIKQSLLEQSKQKALLTIQRMHSSLYVKNVENVIKKFDRRSNLGRNKDRLFMQFFSRVLRSNEEKNRNASFSVFKAHLQDGRHRKQQLIKWLVARNCSKQLRSFMTLKCKASEQLAVEKARLAEKCFKSMSSAFEKNITIFDKTLFLTRCFNRIVSNRIDNVRSAVEKIKALPVRVNWSQKQSVSSAFEVIHMIHNRRKHVVMEQFKMGRMMGRFRMKKSMDLMALKYFDVSRRGFNRYRSIVSEIKANERSKGLSSLFVGLSDVTQINFKNFFVNEAEWKKKAGAFKRLNEKMRERVGQTFQLWRESAKNLKYFDTIQNEKKTRYIEMLKKTVDNHDFHSAKRAIHLFKKNARVTEIQMAFIKRLCESKAGKVVKAMMIMKNLPAPKNKQILAKATKFESLMSRICMGNFRTSFNAYKECQYFGNEKKKVVIRQLVNICSSGIKDYFDIWRKNNKLTTVFGQCEKVGHFAHFSNFAVHQNLRYLMYGNEAKLKRQAIQKLRALISGQKKLAWAQWREQSNEVKAFQEHKAHHLLVLSNLHSRHLNRTVQTAVLNKFCQKRLEQILQKRRQKEKIILSIVDKAQRKRRQNFAESFDRFRFCLYKGNFKKKRAFQNWLNDKISEVHSILDGWNQLAQRKKQEEKRKLTDLSLQCMDSIVKNNFMHILANRRELELKKKMINNLFRTQELKMKGFLNLWKNNVKEMNILKELDRKSKAAILERINRIASAGSEENVRKAIKKFHLFKKTQEIQRNFINRLLKTKSGKVLQAFNKWKTIPAINLGQKYKKAQKFFFKMEGMHKQRLAFTHKVFKQECEEGNTVKKQSILKLFEMTSTGIRRYYNRWEKMTKKTETLRAANAVMSCIETMNSCFSNQLMIVFQDQRQYKIKIWAIQRLIASAQGTTQNYFKKWRNNAMDLKIQEGVSNESKKMALAMFNKVLNGSENANILKCVDSFRKNVIVTDVSKKFFNRLMHTKTGKMVKFFEKLKSIPDTKLAAKKKNAIKFESKLHQFAMKVIRATFSPFKACNFVAIDRKKYCINRLIRASMGEEQKKFLLWRNITREDKILSHSHLAAKAFENMHQKNVKGFESMFLDAKTETVKKQNLCRKMIMNSQFVQHQAFLIWKQTYRTDDIKKIQRNSQKREALRNLINVQQRYDNRSAHSGFRRFRNILIKKQFEKTTVARRQRQNQVIRFVDSIVKVANSHKGQFIESCKNSSIEQNFALKIHSLQNLFQNCNTTFAQNMQMLMRSERETVIIENALNRIFGNFKVSTERAFNMWRQNARMIKIHVGMSNEKKKSIVSLLNNLVNNSEKAQVSQCIQKFHTNFTQTKIQKEILMKILNCKAGKVPYVFMKWKSMPSQTGKKYKAKGIKFESTLNRAHFQRMKFIYNCFKLQSYDANVKKQFAIRKLIAVTQSGSSKMFAKWRQVNNEAKITEKINILSRVFSTSQEVFADNFTVYSAKLRKESQLKFSSLQKIFAVQSFRLRQSFESWRDESKRHKVQSFEKILDKFSEFRFNENLKKHCFSLIKSRYEIQTMKGCINSLWKWKMANTQAHYYSKFIKVFRESEELLILSNVLNKRHLQNLHFAFKKLQETSTVIYDRKKQLIEKYFSKKVKVYMERFRSNTTKSFVNSMSLKYSQNIKIQTLSEVLRKLIAKQTHLSFQSFKANENYLSKTESFALKIYQHKSSTLRESMMKIHWYGYYKILGAALRANTALKQNNLITAFELISQKAKLRQFQLKLQKSVCSSTIRLAFNTIKHESYKRLQKRMSIRMISELVSKSTTKNSCKVIKAFRCKMNKNTSAHKMVDSIEKLQNKLKIKLFQISQNDMRVVGMMQKFKKGSAIKKIIERQEKKAMKRYFDIWKKKENPWLHESIKRFATRSPVISSMAVSMWRIKTFSEASK